jgi:hypothetical protein
MEILDDFIFDPNEKGTISFDKKKFIILSVLSWGFTIFSLLSIYRYWSFPHYLQKCIQSWFHNPLFYLVVYFIVMNKAYQPVFMNNIKYSFLFHLVSIILPFALSMLMFISIAPGSINNWLFISLIFTLIYAALSFILAFISHGLSPMKLKVDGYYIFFILMALTSAVPYSYSFGVVISLLSFTGYFIANKIKAANGNTR